MKLRLAVAIIGLSMVTPLGAQNPAPPVTSRTRAITEKDLFDFIWVANPQLSPDGTRVAFTRVNVDEKRTGYETSIWTVSTSDGESPVRMTTGKHDAQPRWSPDGQRIAFVRGGEKDETGKPKPPQSRCCRLRAARPGSLPIYRKACPDRCGRPTASA